MRRIVKKDEFVEAIAAKSDLSKAEADRALKAVVEIVVAQVAGGERLQIPGLGTFEARERSAREGRNPQTGETMQIAATTVPGFKAATAFKQAVSNQ
jgi:DNA-binding protein HU-beta